MLHFSTANLAHDAHLEEDLKRITLKKALASLVFRR
jgi:hypothetical protein